jgi:hypothetical protein
LRVMRSAERWIFIGYSLPEADFELRHLLKTAQHAGEADRQLAIDVVLKNNPQALERFFGVSLSSTFSGRFRSLDRVAGGESCLEIDDLAVYTARVGLRYDPSRRSSGVRR